jgi:hemerythrin-like domain-containing protein
MNNPLSSLVQEHRTIARLSDALEAYARHVSADNAARADLGHFAEVFRGLVDLVHHEKEESILLPFVVENGFDWDSGTVPEIRREHRHERHLIDVLLQASARADGWSLDDRHRIAETARAIVDFERAHLAKENTTFFPRILSSLDEEALLLLGTKLAKFDTQHHEACLAFTKLASQLIERYAPVSPAAPAVSG